ncbi:MAG: S41 family peptidase [Armatimonadetes bacterium]|nr:S41 family peptidase [Candidatus Hippobium faecium]
MKKLKNLLLAIIFIFVFYAGFATPGMIFAYSGKSLIATLRNIPQRGILADFTAKGYLKVLPTYDLVMKKILNEYYGEADETNITYTGLHSMIMAFDDPFSNFLEPEEFKKITEEHEGNFSGIGAVLQMTETGQVKVNEVMEGAPAEKAGIKAGDYFIAVDGTPTAGKTLDETVKMIRGEEGTDVKITVQRESENKQYEFTVTRGIVKIINSKHTIIDKENGIGYITLEEFTQTADRDIDNALTDLEKNNVKGIILDLRGNPGGLLDMAVAVASRFVDKGIAVIIQERGGIRENIMIDEDQHNHKTYPLVILVNNSSASASEIVSGCVKDHGTGILVGDSTFGKGLVQSQVPLNDGSAVTITCAKYFTPNGVDINKKGIAPDYFVEQNKDYSPDDESTDYQLAAAKKILLNKMGLIGDDELREIEVNSKKLRAEFEKKIAEKEKKEKENK